MVSYTRWAEGDIIDKIGVLYNDGVDLRTSKIQKTEHIKVYGAACRKFGNWKNALSGAGIEYKKLEDAARDEKKQELLGNIKQAYDAGVEMNSSSIKKNQKYKGLYYRAISFYKGKFFWENALRDAGIEPDDVVLQRGWDKERVKRALKARRIAGKALNDSAVNSDDPKLYGAIQNHFDSFDDALKYAGFNPEKIRKSGRYTDIEIVWNTVAYSLKGVDLSPKSITSKSNKDKKLKSVFWAATRRFNGWYNALEFCGINPDEYRVHKTWDKEKVEYEIIRLYDEGEDLNGGHVSKNHPLLYKAAYRHYGSWKNAIEACGLNYEDISKGGVSLSKDDIIAGIKRLAEMGKDLNADSVSGDEDINVRRLHFQAHERFDGGWNEALENAGFDPFEIALRRQYSMEKLSDTIRGLNEAGVSLRPLDMKNDPKNYKHYSAVMTRYNSWCSFLDDIGVDSSWYIRKVDWKNGETVIEHLKKMFPAGIVTGLRTKDLNLAQAAVTYFGGIKNAVKEAGLVYSQGGRVSEKMLDDNPEIIKILLKHNRDFVVNIAELVYYRSKRLRLPTIGSRDILSRSFILFQNALTEKPSKMDLRWYLYKEIYHGLIDMNEKRFSKAYLENKEKVDELRSKAVI